MNFKLTEIGELPFEWEVDTMENALNEIIDYRGKTPVKSETGIVTLSAKSVKDGYIDYSKAYFISESTYQKFMVRGFPRKGDILLTTEAPLGLVARLDREKVGIAQRLLTLRGKKEYLLNDYLMYYLMSNEGKHQLTSRQSGTTVTGIKQKEFRKCLISIPPFEEQKAIARILSTLDEKIEVNNQINKTLENMAQAIFKQWFVDFEFPNEDGEPYKSSGGEMVESELGMIPKGWEVVKLNSVVDICYGKNLPTKKLLSDGYPVFGGNGQIGFYSEYLYEKSQVLIACRGAASGKVIVSLPYSFVTNNSLILEQNGTTVTHEYLKQFCLEKEFYNYATGSAQPQITIANLAKANILIPHRDLMNMFSLIRNSIDSKVLSLFNENNKLVDLRDTLLPKLMSGEIRVPLDEEGEAS